MKNKIPTSIPALLVMADKASNGAGNYGATIPLLQNTKVTMDAEIDALKTKSAAYETGKSQLMTIRKALNDMASDCRDVLTIGRDWFKPTLGYSYNEHWDQTGLRGKLTIPRQPASVKAILESFSSYLAANPSMELVSKDITATHLTDLADQLDTALSNVDEQERVVDAVKQERDDKSALLTKRMANLVHELRMHLSDLDSRWLAFGFNKPGAAETPDQVQGLKAALIGPTAVALRWNGTPRAEYYHVFKKVQGVDADYVSVGSPADLDFTIEGLPAGATIDLIVSAVNNGGEGTQSEKVTIVTHP